MPKEPLSIAADIEALVSLRGLVRISGNTVTFQGIISVPLHSVVLVLTPELALFPRVDSILVHRCGIPDTFTVSQNK